MSRISYVDGKYVEHENAYVHVEDRGYVFADGVYEVALVINDVLIDWKEHCERLQNSLDGLKIDYQVSMFELESIVKELASRNNLNDAMIYLQITRGVAPRLHQFPKSDVKPVLSMTVSPFKLPSNESSNGVKAITLPDLRWKLRHYKTISLLPNTMAKQEAVEAGAEEAILYEEDGTVTEGSSTNVFIVDKEGCLFTHPANKSILGGITRMGVVNVAREDGINVKEEPFSLGILKEAKEVFITSTTKHVLPITNIDGKKVADGEVGQVTKKIIELYSKYINKQL